MLDCLAGWSFGREYLSMYPEGKLFNHVHSCVSCSIMCIMFNRMCILCILCNPVQSCAIFFAKCFVYDIDGIEILRLNCLLVHVLGGLAGLSTLIWAILTKQINIGGGGNGGHVPVSFQKMFSFLSSILRRPIHSSCFKVLFKSDKSIW